MFRNITFRLEKFNLQKYVLMLHVETVNANNNFPHFVHKVFLFLDCYWKVITLHPPSLLVFFYVWLCSFLILYFSFAQVCADEGHQLTKRKSW